LLVTQASCLLRTGTVSVTPKATKNACSTRKTFMAKSKKKAEVVFLVCKETGDYNYALRRKPGGEKLARKKYCPRLRKHTEHSEKKK
jgi:large subunit ribosomal protein L33